MMGLYGGARRPYWATPFSDRRVRMDDHRDKADDAAEERIPREPSIHDPVKETTCEICGEPFSQCKGHGSGGLESATIFPPQDGGYVGTRRTLTPAPLRPELQALIDRCRTIPFTPAMRRAQARSWALGELMLSNEMMTREEASRIVDSVLDAALAEAEAADPWRGLNKLTEEMGEVGQVIGKIAAFPEGDHPDGGPPLKDRLAAEMADVEAAIAYVREVNGVIALPDRVRAKLEKFRKWGLSGVSGTI